MKRKGSPEIPATLFNDSFIKSFLILDSKSVELNFSFVR